MPNQAERNLYQATHLAIRPNAKTYRGQLRETDAVYYQFRLRQRSHFTLRLRGLAANADVELLQDLNQNQTGESGEVVASSRASQQGQEWIDLQGLVAGTYWIKILPKTDRSTSYRLTLSAKPTSRTSYPYEVIQRTNAIRQARGIPALALNTQLTQAAQTYAKSMATDDFFSHRGADGSTWQERIRAADYLFSDAAENLAIGHSSPSRVVQGWMNSPGHRINLLADQVQEIGVGYFFLEPDGGRIRSNHYWAQSFGTPFGTPGRPIDPFEREDLSPTLDSFFDKLDS